MCSVPDGRHITSKEKEGVKEKFKASFNALSFGVVQD
jgi:hypothetical protein